MAGISKPCVTLSIKRGKLEENAEGYIDTDAPLNAIYLATRRQKGKAPPVVGIRKPRPKKPKKAPAPHTPAPARIDIESGLDDLNGLDGELSDLDDLAGDDRPLDQTDKTAADIRLKNIQADLGEYKLQLNKKLVVRREHVIQFASKAKQELRMRLQDMPRRMTPRLTALVRSGSDDREIQALLEREIDDAFAASSEVMEFEKA